eukprot:gene3662-17389_t
MCYVIGRGASRRAAGGTAGWDAGTAPRGLLARPRRGAARRVATRGGSMKPDT